MDRSIDRQTDRQVYQYFGICSFCVVIGDIEYNLGMGLVINTYIFIYIYIMYIYAQRLGFAQALQRRGFPFTNK